MRFLVSLQAWRKELLFQALEPFHRGGALMAWSTSSGATRSMPVALVLHGFTLCRMTSDTNAAHFWPEGAPRVNTLLWRVLSRPVVRTVTPRRDAASRRRCGWPDM